MFRRFLMKHFLVSSEVEHLIDPSMVISFRRNWGSVRCSLLITQTYYYIFISAYFRPEITTWSNGEIDISPELVYQDSYAYDSL